MNLSNKENSNQKEYRTRLAQTLSEVRQFDGTEKSFQSAIRKMIGLEEWLAEVFGEGKEQKRLTEQTERQVAMEMGVAEERTISGMLDLMNKRLEKVLRREEAMQIVQLPGVLLKPGEVPIAEGKGEKVESREICFQERLKKLILLLSQNGIYLDDLIVCKGQLTETMRRQVSYNLVEIPRINKEVLVCDQVGEATFVIDGVLSREILMSLSKEELQEKYGEKVIKVIFKDEGSWQEGLLAALNLKDGLGEKVDVKMEEKLRQEIKKTIPKAEEWVEMKVANREKLKINGMGINALARKFGIEGNPLVSKKTHLELGKKIYGESKVFEYEEYPELTDEQLIEEIKKIVPTAEEWAKIKQVERDKLKINGMGINVLANRFGLEGRARSYNKVYLELGKKVFGENKVFEYEEYPELTNEQLIEEIKKIVPTPEEWAELNAMERSKLKINGMGQNALAARFGIDKSIKGYKKTHLDLGKKIYGENRVFEYTELNNEQLIEEMKKIVPTAEEWAEMKHVDRYKLKINGIANNALARRFGIVGDPVANYNLHLELGKKIYGENKVFEYEEFPDLNKEQLIEEVMKEVPTAEEWAEMKVVNRGKLKINGLGINALAAKFGVPGSPKSSTKVHLDLGRKIYGENIVFEKFNKEKLIEEIKEIFPSPKDWVNLPYKQRSKVRINGMGLNALASKFGMKDNPIQTNKLYLELGEKIYGENDVFKETAKF